MGRLYPDDRLVLDLYESPVVEASRERGLWSSDATKRQRTYIEYGAPVHRGRIVQHHREMPQRDRRSSVAYHPDHDRYELRGHLGTVKV